MGVTPEYAVLIGITPEYAALIGVTPGYACMSLHNAIYLVV